MFDSLQAAGYPTTHRMYTKCDFQNCKGITTQDLHDNKLIKRHFIKFHRVFMLWGTFHVTGTFYFMRDEIALSRVQISKLTKINIHWKKEVGK